MSGTQLSFSGLPRAPLVLPPPLKWAGGKRWLAPRLRLAWNQCAGVERFVEPCVGGMAAALAVMPKHALLNDINPHVINFYRQVQKGLTVEIKLENDRAIYDAHRDRFNELVRAGEWQSAEAAQLFYYLNRTGYNGLCRFNSQGEFNVPFGRYSAIAYRRDFRDYQSLIGGWEFSCIDFAQLDLRPSDFVYCDPPYDVEFTKYSRNGFTWRDQIRMAMWLAGHSGPTLVSNQATPRVVELYDAYGFDVLDIDGPRRIACNGNRRRAMEILAVRNLDLGGMDLTARDTSTGRVLEEMILPALSKGGYRTELQVRIGERLGGGRHTADAVAYPANGSRPVLISLKWQQVGGTAEQKVPFEVMCLAHAVHQNPAIFARAYLVLGGPGWTLREFFQGRGLGHYLTGVECVTVLSLEDFVARANASAL